MKVPPTSSSVADLTEMSYEVEGDRWNRCG